MIASYRAELATSQARLMELLGAKPESRHVRAVLTLLSNVAHIFVYLSGNQRHLGRDDLGAQRVVWRDGAPLWREALRWLRSCDSSDDDIESARWEWIAQLDAQIAADDAGFVAEVAHQRGMLAARLDAVSTQRSALLERLGANDVDAGADALFFRLIGSTRDAGTRSKLAQAWERPVRMAGPELVALADELVQINQRAAAHRGHSSALDATFTACSISVDDAAAFVHAYLDNAVAGHRRLVQRMGDLFGAPGDPMAHWAHYLRARGQGRPLPRFALDRCLHVAAKVAERATGARVELESIDPDVIVFEVRDASGRRGRILVDIIGSSASSVARAVPDPTLPVGRALARCRSDKGGPAVLGFEAAQSLFHEFGHALSHVLVGGVLAGPSGLSAVPAERLEELSEWFEKWVYTAAFDGVAESDASSDEALDLCRTIKRLDFLSTHLHRAVVAAIDVAGHVDPASSLQECFDHLDATHDIAQHCELSELVGYLTSPMARGHPGLALVYPWGYAFGAGAAPHQDSSIDDARGVLRVGGTINRSVDHAAPFAPPDPRAVLRWQEEGLAW